HPALSDEPGALRLPGRVPAPGGARAYGPARTLLGGGAPEGGGALYVVRAWRLSRDPAPFAARGERRCRAAPPCGASRGGRARPLHQRPWESPARDPAPWHGR